jgi:hypothetical protein
MEIRDLPNVTTPTAAAEVYLQQCIPPRLAQQPNARPQAASFLWFLDHTNDAPQSVGLLWTNDRPVAETSDNTQHSKQTDIHAPGRV